MHFSVRAFFKTSCRRSVFLLSAVLLSGCPEGTFTASPSTPQSANENSEESLNECTVGFVTSSPCAIRKSGVVVSQDFGSNILNWSNSGGTTSIVAGIPNGFYANQQVAFSDSNLISSNIKSGVSIFGVMGSMSSATCATAITFAGASGTTSTGSTSTVVQWTPVGSVGGYLILNTTGSAFTVIGSTGSGASSYTVTGLTSNTAYKLRVKAISEQGVIDCNSVDVPFTTLMQTLPNELSQLEMWLKPETLTGNTNGTPVSTWTDSSGNSRSLTSSSTRRPTYNANALNSLGGLVFDGVDDFMSQSVEYATDNFTVFVVAKSSVIHELDSEANSGIDGVVGQKYLLWPTQKGSSFGGAGISFGSNGISVYEHGDSYLAPLAVASQVNMGAVIIVLSYSNKQPSLYSGTTLLRVGLGSTRMSVYAPKSIGADTLPPFQGEVYEFFGFSRTLTTQERTDMVNYLKAKFNL